ncbi:MAG: transglutaminase family protein [Bacteroidetes bacterium]|nr:transglutaminase family protein [Bacteroidota bacterium]
MNPDPKLLRHLIKLLDDDSSVVRQAVSEQLCSFGRHLERSILEQGITLSIGENMHLQSLIFEHVSRRFTENWSAAADQPEEHHILVSAFNAIAEFQFLTLDLTLEELLDQLVAEYDSIYPSREVLQLSEFLFDIKGLRGVPDDYYNPLNSNLIYVIEKRRGVPISLASLYILVGHRLGLLIEGLNFPGHFLTRAHSGRKSFIVDCYNHGKYVDEAKVGMLSPELRSAFAHAGQLRCDSATLLIRVLRNLVHAYAHQQNQPCVELFSSLLRQSETNQADEP